MDMAGLKRTYQKLLSPVFGQQLRMDDGDERKNWIAVILDGDREEFYISLYGTDCAYVYWCNECFLFDRNRAALTSSDTYGEIVYEEAFEAGQLPVLIAELVRQLKDCTYAAKTETIVGKIPSGYDNVKQYTITVKAGRRRPNYRLANITIAFEEESGRR